MKLLGVSLRTIYRYLATGKIRPASQNHRLGVAQEDIVVLAREKDSAAPFHFSKAVLRQALARLSAAEKRIDVLEYLLNLRHQDLSLSDVELKMLYRVAQQYVEGDWPAPAEETWGGLFLRLRTEELDRLFKLTQHKHPWIPFYKLARKMAESPKDLEFRDLFRSGRNHLEDLARIWSVLVGESPSGTEWLFREAHKAKAASKNP